MIISNLHLDNFRSYDKKTFNFEEGVNLVVGPNTAGKSNLLEAIFLLAFGTSPWAHKDSEMVRERGFSEETSPQDDPTKKDMSFVRGFFKGGDKEELEVVLTGSGKRFRVNGVGKRLSDFVPHFHVVLFYPQDLNMVSGSPDLRRKFMDFALGSSSREYSRASRNYDKVRRRRNQLLEEVNKGRGEEEELGFWNAKLLESGTVLQDKRKEFFSEVNESLAAFDLNLKYESSGLTAERLAEYRRREIAAETTLIGPHRDDFSFLMGERGLASYGSRGEQRRAVLALKSAELDFVRKKTGKDPMLLLDDIFSEFDEKNRAQVFDLVDGDVRQAVITTATPEQIPNVLQNPKVIEL